MTGTRGGTRFRDASIRLGRKPHPESCLLFHARHFPSPCNAIIYRNSSSTGLVPSRCTCPPRRPSQTPVTCRTCFLRGLTGLLEGALLTAAGGGKESRGDREMLFPEEDADASRLLVLPFTSPYSAGGFDEYMFHFPQRSRG